ncbi:MAG: sensor histidine kinase [Gemmatimonadaceae bacterium]
MTGDSQRNDLDRSIGRRPGGDETSGRVAEPSETVLLTLQMDYEDDVVLARQRARQVAGLLGFDAQGQTRIATAVSELARNAYEYAGGGSVKFALQEAPAGRAADWGAERRQSMVVRVSDSGPGIAELQAVLDGSYVSRTGMGLGLIGARRLTDRFRIETAPGHGTMVEIARELPRGAAPVGPGDVRRIGESLASRTPRGAFEEVREQNQELYRTLEELRVRQAEVEHLNAELAETNRGVLALYAELDDRAQDLRRASEYKSRFLSDVSHEFRTPLTSVLNMTRFLLDRADGDLTPEQERQVLIIRKSVASLTELVNDLLDLAKIEAGRTTMSPSEFTVGEMFAALRGMFRPLVTSAAVALTFEESAGEIRMHTDEQRLSQVLRNFVSNAIKFTDRGEIRVSASALGEGDVIRFVVRDTGIGIAAADQQRIFHEFAQVEGPVQRRVRGTGLGLSLATKLAGLLGGRIEIESEPGVGSTFALVVPRLLPAEEQGEDDDADVVRHTGGPR